MACLHASTFPGEKLPLKLKEPPMTIIATMWESDDSILIGAESGQTEMPIGLRSQYTGKLQRHPAAPLVWGAAGNPALGIHKFGKWLKQYDWPPPNRDTFEKETTRKVAEINGEQREVWKLARSEENAGNLFEILLVVWLDNQPLILGIDDKGGPSVMDKDIAPFHAIGTGGTHAKLIHYAYLRVGIAFLSKVKQFHAILTFATDAAQQCAPPVNILRVTAQGVSEIGVDELK